MFGQMKNLIDAEKAPHVIEINAISGARVSLLKCREGDAVFWAGHPVGSDGRHCPFGLVVRPDTRTLGGAALNFLAAGKWGKGQQRPDRSVRDAVEAQVMREFVSAALLGSKAEEDPAVIKAALEEAAGYPVTSGRMTKKDKGRYALANLRPTFVLAAETADMRYVVDAKEAVASRVTDGFCEVREGSWTVEAMELSITSNLPWALVSLMQAEGLVLGRKKRD